MWRTATYRVEPGMAAAVWGASCTSRCGVFTTAGAGADETAPAANCGTAPRAHIARAAAQAPILTTVFTDASP